MNYLPPPQPISNKDIRISGDVEVHPTASLASGVILQAAPNSKIIVGADVCIGMGAIINAQGIVKIGSGAILGSGVLIIGACKIGSNCCIGTSSTVFQSDVASMAIVEPGSIIGDASRPQAQTENGRTSGVAGRQSQNIKERGIKNQQNTNTASVPTNFNSYVQPELHPDPFAEPDPVTTVEATAQLSVNRAKKPVVGQLYINELLITLFPHQKKSDRHT